MPPGPHVPSNFTFHLHFQRREAIWTTFYATFGASNCVGPGSAPFDVCAGYPNAGYNEQNKIAFWVTDQPKQGCITLSFYKAEDWQALRALLLANVDEKVAAIALATYAYSFRDDRWYGKGNYDAKSLSQLVGLDSFRDTILRAVENFVAHRAFLTSVGEMGSLNFLLYGVPGSGKTSLVKLVATKYNAPICTVNPQGFSPSNGMDVLMNPNVATTSKIVILLFEDFDRFLCQEHGEKVMNQLLNGIDGIGSRGNVVRFFTGNDCDVVLSNGALINRMTAKFHFEMPGRAMYEGKLRQLLTFHETYDEALLQRFLDNVCRRTTPLSMRPFISFVLMHLFEPNCLKLMCDCIEEY